MVKLFVRAFILACLVLFSTISLADSALALVPLKGQLTATNTCEAFSSIKKANNPDNIRLQPGQTYQVLGKNNDSASHYLVEITNARPAQRWVEISCGTVAGFAPELTQDSTPVVPVTVTKDYLLALSWQPAFCELKPEKAECQALALDPERPEATHFVLHGLWPQPESNIYCGVSKSDIAFDKAKSWSLLPPIEEKISPQTWLKLQAVMPGTASNLHRHEWIKHGTCYPGTPEEYFSEAITLLDTFNQSPVQTIVASNVGHQLAVQAIDQALAVFDPKAGDKVEVKCSETSGRNQPDLGEIWVNLEGEITPTSSIVDLMKNAAIAKAEAFPSCLIDDARD